VEIQKDKYQYLAMMQLAYQRDPSWTDEWSNAEMQLPNGDPLDIVHLTSFFAGLDDLYAGGIDKMQFPEKAERYWVEFVFSMGDADGDEKLNWVEGFSVGLSGFEHDLFHWLDMNDDGKVTMDEAYGIYETIVEDGQKGKFVCDGLEIIDATHGKIDVRAPMGTQGVACGWLIMPSWFYKANHTDHGMGQVDSEHGDGPNKLRRKLPRAAAASMRSKAHRLQRHEYTTKETIKATARKLLTTHGGAGSGAGSGSGSDEAEKEFLASFQDENGTHICSGALIAPQTVITTASCVHKVQDVLGLLAPQVKIHGDVYNGSSASPSASMTPSAAGSGSSDFEPSPGNFKASNMRLHPSAFFDAHYDVALVQLDRPSNAKPAVLYDGGDLGITDCKRMKLSYINWGESWEPAAGSGSPSASAPINTSSADVTLVKLVDHKSCQSAYHHATGSVFTEASGMGSDGGVDTSEICVVVDPKASEPTGPCMHDLGLPLTALVKGEGTYLLGLAHADDCDSGGAGPHLPAVFTRISSSLQWIRASLPSISEYPTQFTMDITVEELGLPEHATLSLYHGVNMDSLLDDGMLDSKCQVPWMGETVHGAMLLILEMPDTHAKEVHCDEECVNTMGFTAKFGMQECPECTKDCRTSVSWDKMGPMFEDKGKGYTGGLGKRMVKRADVEYGVWACMRDWDAKEQMACGARNKELACFWFEEKKREFEFKGLNEQTRLVTPQQYEHGLNVEHGNLRGRLFGRAVFIR
jgi:hypothetical protein